MVFRKVALLFVVLSGGLFAQISGSGIQHATSSPTGKTCSTGSAPVLNFNGALYSCQAGVYAALASSGGSDPIGPAGGDLSGTYPNPTVIRVSGGSGPFLATGQTGATPTTPAASNSSLFFPTAGGPGGIDASGNVYGMPSVNILSLAAHAFWAGPLTGSAAAPTGRAIDGSDLPNPSASTLGGIQSFAAVTNQWVKAISTAGIVSSGQPASTNLSDAAALAYLGNSQTLTGVNTFSQAGGTATPAINVTGSGASGSISRFGAFEIQPVAGLNNGFISDNVYYNGTNFITRGNGFGEMLYFITGEEQMRFSPVVGAGGTATLTTSFKVNQSGSVGLGGSISGSSGVFNGAAFFNNGTATALGTLTIGTNVGLENAAGHYGSHGTAPAIAGTGCAASGTINDNAGAITLTAGAASCTVTFNKAFNVPIPQLSASATGIIPVVSSISTTVLTIGVSAASGTVYYTVSDVN